MPSPDVPESRSSHRPPSRTRPTPLQSIPRYARAACHYLGKTWPLLVLAALSIAIILTSDAPAIYAVAVALGTLSVAIAVRLSAASPDSGPLRGATLRLRDHRITLPIIGSALHLFLLVRVLTEPTNGYDIVLWAAGIAAFGVSFLNLDSLRNLKSRPPVVDTAIVGALILACIVLHAHDLRDWRYAAIGDEIGFFLRVRQILESGIRAPFAIDGMYGNSPMLNSVYQAAVSWVFGGSAWGWKFSAVLSVAITVPAVYWLGCLFSGRIAGIVAAAILVSSHYAMAFTHTGYTHLDALPVAVWAILAFIIGSGTKNAPILFVAGVIAGLALYTALPARVIFPLFVVWAIINRMGPRQLLTLWPMALGFMVCALPALAENGLEIVSVMGLDTISSTSRYSSEIGAPISRIAGNMEQNLLVWWWNDHMSHYTSGSLLDRASGILAIVGIGFAVGKWRQWDKLLIVWLVLTMMATAILSPYPYVPLTRMHSTLIPLALLSGVGVSECLNWIKGYRIYKYVAVGALLIVILALNVWRFQVETPNALTHYPPESLAIKAWQSDECGRDEDTLFVGRDGHLMDLVLLTYIPEGERPKVVEYEYPLVLPPASACKIFFRPDDEKARQTLRIMSDDLSQQPTVVANPSGHSRVEVIH